MMKEIHEQPKAVQDTLSSVIKNNCIDLSSAVETNSNKDYNKIKEIMEIMKNE